MYLNIDLFYSNPVLCFEKSNLKKDNCFKIASMFFFYEYGSLLISFLLKLTKIKLVLVLFQTLWQKSKT